MAITDHLMLEPLIVDRLIEGLGNSVRQVATRKQLADVLEAQQVDPAVHVIYAGDRIPTGANDRGNGGVPQKVSQQWLTVVAVRNAATQSSGQAVRADAGPLITQVKQLMAGWQPDDQFTAFKRAQPPAPAYSGTFGYFPILWTTEFYE